jgi:hypothetical protein
MSSVQPAAKTVKAMMTPRTLRMLSFTPEIRDASSP